MPVPRLEVHRIRLGTHAVGSVTSTYEVREIALQSDQDPYATPWLVRGRDSNPVIRARSSDVADLTKVEDGFYQFTWSFSYFTFGMVAYWNGTLLGGAVSPAVTVMTYDQNNVAVYLTCTASALRFPRDGESHPGGWKNVRMEFVGGTIIT